MKAGKLRRTITQLEAYRNFGSPNVALLDTYICESGFMAANKFPPASIQDATLNRIRELRKEGFGYQVLPFEHGREGEDDVGLVRYAVHGNPLQGLFAPVPARMTEVREPFVRWAQRLDEFFESASGNASKKVFKQIVFCRACRRLGLLAARDDDPNCPTTCSADLIEQ